MKKIKEIFTTRKSHRGGGHLENKTLGGLKKFSKNKKQKRILIGSIVGVILLIGGIYLYRTFALYEEKKEFNVLRGQVPNFSNWTYTYVVNEKTVASKPASNAGYTQNGLTCSGVTNYSWDNTNWKVSYSTSNLTSQNVSCTVSFCTKDYCNATFRQLVKLIGSSAVSFDDLVNSEYDINNIVKSQSAMELIASSKDYLSKNIKSSSNYCSKEVWKKFLDSTVLTNVQKYNGRLPFYLYNNGTTGFSWSRSSYNGNCTTSECSKGTISSTSTLLVKDATTTQYVFGEIASEAIDITDYSSMIYEANFQGTNTGSSQQKVQQGYRILAGSNVLENGNMRDGVTTGSISWGDVCMGNIISYSGSQQIKIRLTTGGLTSYKASISVPYIYFY